MKILHFFPWASWGTLGGTEKYIVELAKEQSKNHSVTVIYPRAGSQSLVVKNSDCYREIALPDNNPSNSKLINYGLKASLGLKSWNNLLFTEKFDVVHFHCYEPYQLRYVKVAKKYLVKTLFTPHVVNFTCSNGNLINGVTHAICDGWFSPKRCEDCVLSNKKYKKIDKLKIKINLLLKKINFISVMKYFDKIILLNQNYYDVLVKNNININKLTLVRPRLIATAVAQDSSECLDELKVVYIGRLSKFKGLDNLLKASERFQVDNIKLYVYGPPADINILDYDPGGFSYQGVFQFEEVGTILSKYDVLILPSISYEMMPLVLQEAINSGLYVIGTDVPGIAEILNQGVNGRIIPVNSIDSIVDSLRLVKNQYVNNSQFKIETFDDLAVRINRVYEQLIVK